jgi:hypothetical protein
MNFGFKGLTVLVDEIAALTVLWIQRCFHDLWGFHCLIHAYSVYWYIYLSESVLVCEPNVMSNCWVVVPVLVK